MTSPVNDVEVTDHLVETISSQLPDISTDQVGAVLSAWRDVLTGDPIGTVRRSKTGAVAHRVTTDGVHLWRVTEPDGGQYNDMAPTLKWPVIHQPKESK